MDAAEHILHGSSLEDATISVAAQACTQGANPLPETRYKVDLIAATVTETLERLRTTR
jgi:xanthine dehydrogenase YagS FAD-binding subunit